MKPTLKAKIIAVSNETRSITQKGTTRKIVLSVVEVKSENPFGHSHEDKNPFEVEVYNHNIENFNISESLIGETGNMELIMTPIGPNQFRSIVNDLSFVL